MTLTAHPVNVTVTFDTSFVPDKKPLAFWPVQFTPRPDAVSSSAFSDVILFSNSTLGSPDVPFTSSNSPPVVPSVQFELLNLPVPAFFSFPLIMAGSLTHFPHSGRAADELDAASAPTANAATRQSVSIRTCLTCPYSFSSRLRASGTRKLSQETFVPPVSIAPHRDRRPPRDALVGGTSTKRAHAANVHVQQARASHRAARRAGRPVRCAALSRSAQSRRPQVHAAPLTRRRPRTVASTAKP